MFNMGLESFFLNQYAGEGCLVYRNTGCVVLGKNQNPYREVNVRYCKEHALPVLRRISGGGAVFQDLGNINTAFFGQRRSIDDNLYQRWTEPPIQFLISMGITAERDGRNGLEVGGKKFSGSAQALKKERFLHHATLLYSSHLPALESCLTPLAGLVEGRGIDSVRSPVVNLLDSMSPGTTVESFQEHWVEFLVRHIGANGPSEVPPESRAVVEELADAQFSQWEWNIGRTPRFEFRLPIQDDSLVFEIRKGMIESVCLASNATPFKENKLVGNPFSVEVLLKFDIRKQCPDLEHYVF